MGFFGAFVYRSPILDHWSTPLTPLIVRCIITYSLLETQISGTRTQTQVETMVLWLKDGLSLTPPCLHTTVHAKTAKDCCCEQMYKWNLHENGLMLWLFILYGCHNSRIEFRCLYRSDPQTPKWILYNGILFFFSLSWIILCNDLFWIILSAFLTGVFWTYHLSTMEIQMDKPTCIYSRRERKKGDQSIFFSQKTVILQEQFGKPNTFFHQHQLFCYVKYSTFTKTNGALLLFSLCSESETEFSCWTFCCLLYSLSGLAIVILLH